MAGSSVTRPFSGSRITGPAALLSANTTAWVLMHVAGSWRVSLGVWLKQLGAGPMRFAQKHAASWKLSIADRERNVELVDAAMRGDTLTLKLNPGGP